MIVASKGYVTFGYKERKFIMITKILLCFTFFFVGVFVGIVLMALCVAAKNNSIETEEYKFNTRSDTGEQKIRS